ncbi:MAG: hypothetical protein IT385_21225 [Deltaproteobacteria bacterium]|nr:hypothetical protein [Deltaproteobacteria bacterium]
MRRARTALVALALGACATDPEAVDAERRARGSTAAWFAVKLERGERRADGLADCDLVLGAVSQAATRPGVAAPDPHRLGVGERWCVLAPDAPARGPAVRSDGVAQRASGIARRPAIAFWVDDAAWSWALFDRGEPVVAMESHYGEPQLIGDEARGAELVDLAPGALRSYLQNAREPDVADALATRIGVSRPGQAAPLARLVAQGPTADPSVFDPKRHPPSPRMDAGQWAVLPPMGVVLVKSVNPDGTYTLVDDDKTFPIPIERAGGLGMRRLANVEDAGRALQVVDEGVEVGPEVKEYSAERSQGWLDALKRGDLLKIAQAYAELCAVQSERALYAVELGLLATSREWLAEEIGTVQGKARDDIDKVLDDACD